MKILIFSTAYFPFVGGAEVAMKEITDRLEGYDLHMVTAKMDRKLPNKETVGNITVHRVGIGVPMFDKLYLAAFGDRKGKRLHRKHTFDGVWSLMASYNGFAASRFVKSSKLPMLLTLQEGDPIEHILHRVRYVRGAFSRIFARATVLQAISTYLLRWGKDMGFAGKNEEVIPNAVDVKRFTAHTPETKKKHIRDSWGLKDDDFALITASRLAKKNGLGDVISAMNALPKNVHFIICGTGELESEYRAQVSEFGVKDRVHFLGNVSHEELPAFLQSSDAFIRPSLSEGLGNSFLEAMAAGIPTIGTMVGGIPDFLEPGKTGFACEPNNPDSIVQTIHEVMALSDDQKQEIHKQAMNIIEKRFNWTYVVERMDVLLRSLSA